MYILKNALRSINRSKGRNILIGIIVLVIAVSSCVALSIREAAHSAEEAYSENLEIRAQISMNRQKMMEGLSDRESMKEAMTNQEELPLEELLIYSEAESVKDFYYTGTASINTNGDWEAIDTTGIVESEEESSGFADAGGQNSKTGKMTGMMQGGRMGVQGA